MVCTPVREGSNRPVVPLGEMEADRLSALPDDLALVVMSFLSSRQAVQLSALSRRWRHLWRSARSIDVDSRDFIGTAWPPQIVTKEAWEKFERFTDNLLLLHDASPLDRLRVHLPFPARYHACVLGCGAGWISDSVARYRPAALEIHVGDAFTGRFSSFPPPPLPWPGSCRLRRLSLHGVALDEGFPERLRAGCPVLEDLVLACCRCAFREIACGTELRRLAIVSCGGLAIVAGPRLASLCLAFDSWYYRGGVHVAQTESIVRASILLLDDRPTTANFVASIWKLFNVRHLELSGSEIMAILREEPKIFQTFHNLRTLSIGGCDMTIKENILALGRFLQKTPGLEKLTLHHRRTYGLKDGLAKWRTGSQQLQDQLSFKCDNLTSVEIKYKEDEADELFELFRPISRNLMNTSIRLTKVYS